MASTPKFFNVERVFSDTSQNEEIDSLLDQVADVVYKLLSQVENRCLDKTICTETFHTTSKKNLKKRQLKRAA